ncbi:MAG: hypothetical protein J3R72DRAFT_144251 [Linnemannia gamsii]|nr:MAG: hypothetical protein J3R72DRAFT_144251 [Linnemannia gamsii]
MSMVLNKRGVVDPVPSFFPLYINLHDISLENSLALDIPPLSLSRFSCFSLLQTNITLLLPRGTPFFVSTVNAPTLFVTYLSAVSLFPLYQQHRILTLCSFTFKAKKKITLAPCTLLLAYIYPAFFSSSPLLNSRHSSRLFSFLLFLFCCAFLHTKATCSFIYHLFLSLHIHFR